MAKKNTATRIKKQKAQKLFNQNRCDEARELYQQICRLDQDDAEAWVMLGIIEGRSGLINEAITYFRKATTLRPDFAAAWYNLGKACKDLGHFEEAVTSYETALRFQPDWPEALNNLGQVLSNLGRMFDAIECYRRVTTINPDHAVVYKSLSGLLIALGELDEAAICIRKLAELKPDSLDVKIAEAKILQRRGCVDQAFALSQSLVESNPGNLEVDFLYASLCQQTFKCEDAIRILDRWLIASGTGLDYQQLSMLHYKLGDLYDALADYQQAFKHYQSANLIKSQGFKSKPFNMDAFATFIDTLIMVFSREAMSKVPRTSYSTDRPIFIVGMPRSGTTLVEQILASHPEVYGAGELQDVNAIALKVLNVEENGQFSPASIHKLRQKDCDDLARHYLDRLLKLTSEARYVTDKMPQNFLHLGMIAILFPQARIIHCVRNPLDTCISCFFQNFGTTHAYTYNLDMLARYYTQYQRLMQHWRAVLDVPILDVSYEELVADQESVTRSLLEFCKLEWNDQCLRFHENTRKVDTLSHAQVRQPIYIRSVARWKCYESYIGSLVESLTHIE